MEKGITKKGLLAVVLAGIMIVAMFGLLSACKKEEPQVNSIKEVRIDESTTSNNVTYNNYKVYFTDDVDWAGITSEERQELALEGFNQAMVKKESDTRFNYTLTGYYNNGAGEAFQLDIANSQLIITLPDANGDGILDIDSYVAVEIP